LELPGFSGSFTVPAPPPSKPVAHHRARVASLSRDRKPDDSEFIAARQDLAAQMLAEHIEKVLAKAPPLTAEQRTRLAELLKPVRVRADGEAVPLK
jgi:hypothetical protein